MTERRLPELDEPSAFFWTGGADGRLRLRWCDSCEHHQHPSAELCSDCFSLMDTQVVSGRGHVVAVTVNAHAWPGAPEPPYAVVVVALEGASGVRLTSSVPGDSYVGQAVRIAFQQAQDVWLPIFEPDERADETVRLPEPTAVTRAAPTQARFEHKVALTGIGSSDVGRRLDRTDLDLTVQACRRAVADAGLALTDIDGLSAYPGPTGMPGVSSGGVRGLEQVLGVQPTWHAGGQEGAGQLAGVVAAMLAVAAGLCRHVLCFTSVRRAGLPSEVPGRRVRGEAQWRIPYGAVSPAHWIALAASQYLARYGADREALGWLAVSSRRHAAHNTDALHRDPLDIEDYLAARIITTPFGLLDCDVPCDGAFAVVVSARDAASLAVPVVRVAAVGTQITESPSWDQGTLTHQSGVFGPAAHLWTRTDLRPSDVDVAALYDGFTFNALTWLEALGFCGIGEGSDFVKGGERIGPGGALPVNPHGGQLAAGRSNGFGGLHEAVRQIMGQAGDRQVRGAEVAVVTSGGGIPGCCLLLTGDR